MATASSLAPVITLNWNENIGPSGEQIVFPTGALNFAIKPSTGPVNPFSITIPLATPFTYDPRNGGLVVDLFTYGGTRGLLMDAGDSFGLTGALNAPLGRIQPSLVMELSFRAIPEATPLVYLVLGLTAFFVKGKRTG